MAINSDHGHGWVDAIGGTPLVQLTSDYGAEVWVKVEAAASAPLW